MLQIGPYPSLLILRVSSSHRLLVSTKMMVLFSFSLMISSSKRINLTWGGGHSNIDFKSNMKIFIQLKWVIILTCHPSLRHYRHRQSAGCCGWRSAAELQCWSERTPSGSPRPADAPLWARWRSTLESACQATGERNNKKQSKWANQNDYPH